MYSLIIDHALLSSAKGLHCIVFSQVHRLTPSPTWGVLGHWIMSVPTEKFLPQRGRYFFLLILLAKVSIMVKSNIKRKGQYYPILCTKRVSQRNRE